MPTELSPRPTPTATVAARRSRLGSPLREARRRDAELRQVVLRVRSWGLRRGRTCPSDALTAVVGVALAAARAGRVSPKRWTAARVEALRSSEVHAWCAALGADEPAGLGEALVLWIDFLAAHRSLDAGSDGPEALRAAATRRSRRGLGVSRRRHPAGRGSG